MLLRRWMWIVWPAFLVAGVMEVVVFAFVDPLEITVLANYGDFSRLQIYTGAFFVFWAVMVLACAMTALLALSAKELNPVQPAV